MDAYTGAGQCSIEIGIGARSAGDDANGQASCASPYFDARVLCVDAQTIEAAAQDLGGEGGEVK